MARSGDRSHWHWDRYWQADRLASCFDSDSANYADAIERDWTTFFEGLAERTRILDLATGNGAIALMAARVSRDRTKAFAVHGVDTAAIAPNRYLSSQRDLLEQIAFHPRTPAESLPFENASFDVAVSQYGLEYTEIDQSLGELGRVLQSGGCARFIVHASKGRPAKQARADLAAVDLIVDELDLLNRAREAYRSTSRFESAKTPQAPEFQRAAQEAVQRFRSALRTVSEHRKAKGDPSGMVTSAGQLLTHTFQARKYHPLEALLGKVDELEAEIYAHRERLHALVASALDEQACYGLEPAFRQAGFVDLTVSPVVLSGERLAGYRLTTRKS